MFVQLTSLIHVAVLTNLSIPDVGTVWSLKHKAVIGVERRGLLFHLHSPGVKLVGASDVKQPGSIDVIAVLIYSVLEATSSSSRVNHHLPLEHQQEVVRLLILNHPYLDRGSTIFVV